MLLNKHYRKRETRVKKPWLSKRQVISIGSRDTKLFKEVTKCCCHHRCLGMMSLQSASLNSTSFNYSLSLSLSLSLGHSPMTGNVKCHLVTALSSSQNFVYFWFEIDETDCIQWTLYAYMCPFSRADSHYMRNTLQ